MGFRVQGCGCGVWDLEVCFREGAGCGMQGFGIGVEGSGLEVGGQPSEQEGFRGQGVGASHDAPPDNAPMIYPLGSEFGV